MEMAALDGLLRPKAIAIVGASNTPGKIGHTVVKNLIDCQYEGGIYPINPKGGEILGLQVYPSVLNVPHNIDAAILVIPARLTPKIAAECGQKGIKGLIILASGFSEMGRTALEDEVVRTAHQYGMRVLGPNIVGVLSNSDKCNASFAPFLPLPGSASLVSQSGALLIAMGVATFIRHVGFDKLISIGNMSDVNFADLVQWLDSDRNTSCISLYIEGLQDGRRFINNALKATKPIIGLKAGVSAHGAAAAASHTGSLAGSGQIYEAAFKQAGIVMASDLNSLFDRTLALSLQPPMRGDNLLIITNGGGVGVLSTDSAERYGIPLRFAPEDIQKNLQQQMPEYGSAKNPVDLIGMAHRKEYEESTRYAYAHDWVDGLVILYCETDLTIPMEIVKGIKSGVDTSGATGKPIIVSCVGGERSEQAMRWLVTNGIPAYNEPDTAVNAMAALRDYAKNRELAAQVFQPYTDIDEGGARTIISQVRSRQDTALTEIESKAVFKAYGLPITETYKATSVDKAVSFAGKIGFPVVVKIISPDILHKSDAGGVVVNVRTETEVREAYNKVIGNASAYNPDADIHGVAIQEMAPWGTEVILGSINTPTFGPTIMFGLGGIFVEILKDVTFRVAPVNKELALKMLHEIQGSAILLGTRGEKARDLDVLADVISRYSQMIYDLGDEILESDANPVIVYAQGEGIKIVDARLILKG